MKFDKYFEKNRAEFDADMPPPDLWKGIEQKLDAHQNRQEDDFPSHLKKDRAGGTSLKAQKKDEVKSGANPKTQGKTIHLDTESPGRAGKDKTERNLFFRASVWKAAAALLLTFSLGYWVAQSGIGVNGNCEGEGNSGGLAQIETSKETKPVNLSELSPEAAEAEGFYLNNIATFTSELKTFENEQPELVQEFLKEHEALDLMYLELKKDLKQDMNNEQILNLMIQNLQLRITVLQNQKSILEGVNNRKNQKNPDNFFNKEKKNKRSFL